MKQYQSEKIDELAIALCKAQSEFPDIPKTKTVDFIYNGKRTNYTYADLSDVIKAIRPVLAKHGLSFDQNFRIHERLVLWTMLMHTSGQWKGGEFPIEIGSKHQETGSNITYIRRYTLCAALGIQSEEDNDAQFVEKAMGAQQAKDPKDCKSAQDVKNVVIANGSKIISPKWEMNSEKTQRVETIFRASGWDRKKLHDEMMKLKIKKFNLMNQSQYDSICRMLTESAFEHEHFGNFNGEKI